MHCAYTLAWLLATCLGARGHTAGVSWNLVAGASESSEKAKAAFRQRAGIRPDVDPHQHHRQDAHDSHALAAREPTTKDTSSVPRPRFGSVGYGNDILHCTQPGKVALTFDDGPGQYTSDLLDVLARNNVKATFFLVGNSPDRGEIGNPANPTWAQLMRRMHAEGHQLGSHSWTHADFSVSTPAQRHAEVIMNERAFVDVMGFFPTYFRPPYTRCPADCMAELAALGYHVADYDVDTKDWEGDYARARNTYTTILSQGGSAKQGSSWITLAHDVHEPTVHGFTQFMIDQARAMGYQLVTFGECLGDDQRFWYREPVTGMPWDSSKPVGPLQPSSPVADPASKSTSAGTASTASSTVSAATSSPTVVTTGKNATASPGDITPQPSVSPIPGVNALGNGGGKASVLGAGVLGAIAGAVAGVVGVWLLL